MPKRIKKRKYSPTKYIQCKSNFCIILIYMMRGCCVLKAKVVFAKISMFPFLGKEAENFDNERQFYQEQI